MTTGRKPTQPGKGAVKKLKVKKETLKDLGAGGKDVKGGNAATGLCQTRACGTGTGT